MNYMAEALSAGNQNTMSKMHTAFPALVVSYDEGKHTATIQPLFKYDDETSYPQVQGVPVAKWRYRIMQNKHITESGQPHSHAYTWSDPGGSGTTSPESAHKHPIEFEEIVENIKLLLQPGDVVLCVCCERSIDSMSSKQVHNPQSKRQFDVSDAVIVCIL